MEMKLITFITDSFTTIYQFRTFFLSSFNIINQTVKMSPKKNDNFM